MKRLLIRLATAGFLFPVDTVAAQTPLVDPAPRTLEQTLRHALAERGPMPLAFSTRDTAFALSLPKDEPAEVYLRLTLGRNGKIKEKLTRVDANHIAAYVAPAFVAATRELRVDPALCARMAGKDTVLTITVPLDYQCVLDTMSKEVPLVEITTDPPSGRSIYESEWDYERRSNILNKRAVINYSVDPKAPPTRIRYYVVFPAKQPE